MQNIIGIDVSKDTLDVVLIHDKGQKHKTFSNDTTGYNQLHQWLVSLRIEQVHACLEATGQYGDGIAEYLYEMGHLVSVTNPARIKHYGESKLHRNKTDKADAFLIAEFCLKENPPYWKPLLPEMKHLRALERRLSDLQTNCQQERNRLKSGEKDPSVLDSIKEHIDYLEKCIGKTNKDIREYIDQNPDLKSQHKLLTSIPGIGEITAARLLAEIGDISAFDSAPQLAAYAGLNPRGFQSGSSVHKKTRISKQGRAELRYILYMPALVAMQYNPVIRSLCHRLDEKRLPKKAIVIAAMHKLLHLVYGVLKHQTRFDPDFGAQFNFAS
jgi:transposase